MDRPSIAAGRRSRKPPALRRQAFTKIAIR